MGNAFLNTSKQDSRHEHSIKTDDLSSLKHYVKSGKYKNAKLRPVDCPECISEEVKGHLTSFGLTHVEIIKGSESKTENKTGDTHDGDINVVLTIKSTRVEIDARFALAQENVTPVDADNTILLVLHKTSGIEAAEDVQRLLYRHEGIKETFHVPYQKVAKKHAEQLNHGRRIHVSSIPMTENTDKYGIVTDTEDKAQSIKSKQWMQVSVPVLGQENAATSLSKKSIGQNLSRSKSGTLFQKLKLPKEKVFKFACVKPLDLPSTFSKEFVLSEGFVTIRDLLSMLKNCDIHCNLNDIVIPTYLSKTLSIPCTTSNFMWSLETIKKNVGQGKLYVIVSGFQDGRSNQDTDEGSVSERNTDGTDSDYKLQRPAFGTETPSTRRGLDSKQKLQSRKQWEIASTSSINSSIKVCEREDEEICRAIEASLHDNHIIRTDTITHFVEQVLKEFQHATVNNDIRNYLIVSRPKVLLSAYRGLDRKTFNPRGKLYVKFSGELGQDNRGTRRELFRLALKNVIDYIVFEGPASYKYFTPNLTLSDEKKYRLAGRLVFLSLAQDGPGLHGIHLALYDLMTGLEPDMSTVVATLPTDVQEIITQLGKVDSDSKRDMFLSDYMDWISDRGFRMSLNGNDHLIFLVKKHHLYNRTLPEITEFKLGLNHIENLGKLVTSNTVLLFKPLFCQTHTILTKVIFDSLCQVLFSEQGSNVRPKEDETICSGEVLLQDMQDGNVPMTLEELLVNVTGAERITLVALTSGSKYCFMIWKKE